MFQLPTGYNFGKSPQMDEVAECEETPPTKRRESVHVSTISDDVIHGICRSDNVYSCQDTSSKTNAEDFESCNCVGNPAIFSDKSLDTIEKQTDNRKDSQPENELALNNILQYGHVVINQNISSDIVRKSRGSSSDLAHIFRSSCSSDRSLLSTSTSRQESVGSVADVIAVSDDVINDDVFMLESYKENN